MSFHRKPDRQHLYDYIDLIHSRTHICNRNHPSTQTFILFGTRLPDGNTHICSGNTQVSSRNTQVRGRLSHSESVCQPETPIYVWGTPKYPDIYPVRSPFARWEHPYIYGEHLSTWSEHPSTWTVNPFGTRLPDGNTHICSGNTQVHGRNT
jgi:hypothetical protein